MMRRTCAAFTAALMAGGCAVDVKDIGREPHLTPVGSGIGNNATPAVMAHQRPADYLSRTSLWTSREGELFRDQRASRVGDLLTVNIQINDRASLGNTSDRSKQSKGSNNLDFLLDMFNISKTGKVGMNFDSDSSTKGEGSIARSENIKLSVAAVVTDVLPNGNLMISGSQEVRVNFELRNLTIAGIVRPRDVSKDNMISYDKIAEARVSYGGRGRIMEVQQPGLVHQVFDIVKPF